MLGIKQGYLKTPRCPWALEPVDLRNISSRSPVSVEKFKDNLSDGMLIARIARINEGIVLRAHWKHIGCAKVPHLHFVYVRVEILCSLGARLSSKPSHICTEDKC